MKRGKDKFGAFCVAASFAYAAALAALLTACNYFPSATHYKCVLIGDPVSSEILVEGAGGASLDPAVKASLK